MRKHRLLSLSLAAIVIVGGVGIVSWTILTRPYLSSAERGRRLAEKTGCFACHGDGGKGGVFNDGRADISVPNWTGDLMMFARDSSQIREWIANGVTSARAKSLSWQEERDKGVLEMPAFGRRLSREQIDDLVAYIMAVQNHDTPGDSLALVGQARIDSLGCIGCHGAGGRFSRPNPGSFKGYVPSWSGPDFPDLVHDSAEFDQWVSNGISKRFENNPLARYFLDRAVLKMPAFRDHLKTGDLDAIWAYILWLRADSSNGTVEKGK